jgi:dTDP-4-dehydrorhamnose reductase
MRILVTGAKGMLGKDLIPVLRAKNHHVIATDIEELDITDLDQVYRIGRQSRPEVVVNCAAYTQVDKAEEEADKAFAINELGARNIATACRDLGADICHVSTDYVFDGEKRKPYAPDDETNPINTYGASKLAGENAIRQICDRFYIVRTSWLYGKNGRNFVYTILDLAKNRKEIRVVDDQIGSPTWTVTLSRVLSELIGTKRYGIYHVTDETEGGISWFRFAQEIVKLNQLEMKVIPIKTKDFPLLAKRPKKTVLDLSGAQRILSGNLPFWTNSLKRFFSEINSAGKSS